MKGLVLCFLSALLWSFSYQDSCTTPLGRISECISLYRCPQLLAAFHQPLTEPRITFLKKSQCGFIGLEPAVCCGPLVIQEETVTRPETTRPPVYNNNNAGDVEPAHHDDSSPAPSRSCGLDTNGDRLFGGQITDLDEFPWMALLGYRKPSGDMTYQCGGVLLNRRYVLTAAHCIRGEINVKVGVLTSVRLGEYNTQQERDCIDDVCADPPQEIAVHGAYPNPGYVDNAKNNRKDDIGIVRLARRATYSYYVQPICLFTGSDNLQPGLSVFVAGWGKTLSGKNSPVKLKLSIPIFDKRECSNKYRGVGATLSDGQLCAGGVFAQDTCKGDSGGPLMKRRSDGAWETIGVVSFGYGCGGDGWPGVYTSVTRYSEWILSTLRSTNV